jgi:hypothetical protein
MSNEKQQKILEMAKDICRYQPCCNDVCKPISACDALRYAERAVEAGYSKQSEGEWIKIFRYSRNWDSFYDLTCPGCGALFKHIPESDISSRYKYCSVCGLKMKGGAE